MFPGGRYDLKAARAAARAAKRRARIKAIASNVFLLAVVVSLATAGKVAWDAWQEKLEREREARLEAERQEEARLKEEAARREVERKEREAARLKLEAIRAQERKDREEARLKAQLERERIAADREEARRRAKENEAEQKERREMVRNAVSRVQFSIDAHLACEFGADEAVQIVVDGRRWTDLSSAAASDPIGFLDMARGGVTNDFSEVNYPGADVVSRIVSNLASESFTMVLRIRPELARGKRFFLLGVDPAGGVALPDGAREMKDKSGRVTGWTLPFVFGDEIPAFLVSRQNADRITREWESLRKRIVRDAERLTPDTKDGFVKERLRRELPAFARSVAIEIANPPPQESVRSEQPVHQPKSVDSSKYRIKGLNGDSRTLRGPAPRK